MTTPVKLPPPFEARDALVEIGAGIRTARLRRRQTARDLAGRMGVSLRTLLKLERGDPGVAIGTFATALWALQMLAPVQDALRPEADRIAAALEANRAPRRARRRRDPIDDL